METKKFKKYHDNKNNNNNHNHNHTHNRNHNHNNAKRCVRNLNQKGSHESVYGRRATADSDTPPSRWTGRGSNGQSHQRCQLPAAISDVSSASICLWILNGGVQCHKRYIILTHPIVFQTISSEFRLRFVRAARIDGLLELTIRKSHSPAMRTTDEHDARAIETIMTMQL